MFLNTQSGREFSLPWKETRDGSFANLLFLGKNIGRMGRKFSFFKDDMVAMFGIDARSMVFIFSLSLSDSACPPWQRGRTTSEDSASIARIAARQGGDDIITRL
jgi:hypothetical protein